MREPHLNYRELYVTFTSPELPVLIKIMKERILGEDGITSLSELVGNNGHTDFDLEVAEKFDSLPDDLRRQIGDAAEVIARGQLEG